MLGTMWENGRRLAVEAKSRRWEQAYLDAMSDMAYHVALRKALDVALAQLAPDHPLLEQDRRERIGNAGRSAIQHHWSRYDSLEPIFDHVRKTGEDYARGLNYTTAGLPSVQTLNELETELRDVRAKLEEERNRSETYYSCSRTANISNGILSRDLAEAQETVRTLRQRLATLRAALDEAQALLEARTDATDALAGTGWPPEGNTPAEDALELRADEADADEANRALMGGDDRPLHEDGSSQTGEACGEDAAGDPSDPGSRA